MTTLLNLFSIVETVYQLEQKNVYILALPTHRRQSNPLVQFVTIYSTNIRAWRVFTVIAWRSIFIFGVSAF